MVVYGMDPRISKVWSKHNTGIMVVHGMDPQTASKTRAVGALVTTWLSLYGPQKGCCILTWGSVD